LQLFGPTLLLLLLSPFPPQAWSSWLSTNKEYKKEELLDVKTDGTCSNHWSLKGTSHSNNATQKKNKRN
jgi:hypothetical protein